MNLLQSKIWRAGVATLGFALLASFSGAAGTEPATISAKDLAASLSALQDGASYVRLRLEVKQPTGTTKISLQLQIKERRTTKATGVVYQVLWPKERKGEAVLLHKADGSPPTGSLFVPPDKPRPLKASQMTEALFGSDLSYQDVIENFFGWENQTIVGTEVLNRVSCLILESTPDKDDPSSYARVRSWIDFRRRVPLRVEKYLPSGRLARRIEIDRRCRRRKHPGNAIEIGNVVGQRRFCDLDLVSDDGGIKRQDLDRSGMIDLGAHDRCQRAFGDLDGTLGKRDDLAGAQPATAFAEMGIFARSVDLAVTDLYAAGAARAAPAAGADDAEAAAPRGLIDRLPGMAC